MAESVFQNYSLEASRFVPPTKTYLSSDEILRITTPIYKNCFVKLSYDRLSASLQFVEHYLQLSDPMSPIDALKTFQFSPLTDSCLGGPCVSLACELLSKLPRHVKGYITGAKLPKRMQQFAFPEYAHTAILIDFLNPQDPNDQGYILLDLSFDYVKPILLKRGEPTFYYGKELFIKDEHIVCQFPCEKLKEKQQMIYKTTRMINPIASSAVPMLISDRRLSVIVRGADGTYVTYLCVELDRKRVVMKQQNELLEPIIFDAIRRGKLNLLPVLRRSSQLKSSSLISRVAKIVENHRILDDLYESFLHLLVESEDFSITGPMKVEDVRAELAKGEIRV